MKMQSRQGAIPTFKSCLADTETTFIAMELLSPLRSIPLYNPPLQYVSIRPPKTWKCNMKEKLHSIPPAFDKQEALHYIT